MKQFLKSTFRNAIRAQGWDLVKTPNLMDFLRSRDIDLVFDVGANRGDYAEQIRRWGYRGRILSLEPTAEAFNRLVEARRGDDLWRVLKVAAGAEEGEASIHVSRDTSFNSILPITEVGAAFDPNIEVVAVERVPVVTVDSLLDDVSFERAYLKIDTQGFERQVLEGSAKLLDRCLGVQLEMPVEHLYEGVWSFDEALAYMRERGFVPAQMTPVTVITSDRASVTEFDCVFRRA